MYIAHIDEKGKEQPVFDHLGHTAEFTGIYASRIGMRSCGELIGWVHDVGKLNEEWLDYIKKVTASDAKKEKMAKGPDHSSAGAIWIIDRYYYKEGRINPDVMERLTAQIMAVVIMSHHGQALIDIYDENGDSPFLKRLDKEKEDAEFKRRYEEVVLEIDKTLDLQKMDDLYQNGERGKRGE